MKIVRVSVLSPLQSVGVDCFATNAGVHVRAFSDQQFDKFHLIHVRIPDWIVAAFDVPVICGDVQGIPSAVISDIRIGAMVEKV